MKSLTLRYTNLDDIEERHLDELVRLKVPEIRFVEYKSALPGGSDAQGKEFLADVCSFANAGGGDLVYGMEEMGGAPTALTGVPMPDPDAEVLRLENTILSGIDPRPLGFRSRYIPLSKGNYALVIRVSRSFARPHAVDYKGRFRYYSRNSAGKYPMDVAEVSSAVLASEAVADRLRAFRAGRLADVVAGQTPVAMNGVATIVLHVLPLSSFDLPAPSVDLSAASNSPEGLLPIGMGGNTRHNFDGLLSHGSSAVYGDPETHLPESYALLFRSGIVEAVDSWLLWPEADGPIIPSVAFERDVLDAVYRYLALLSHLSVEGPVYVALSLLGVRDYEMAYESVRSSRIRPVDRDALVVPEVAAEDPNLSRVEVERLMRPALDQVWNACGYAGSMLYDADGRWAGDRR